MTIAQRSSHSAWSLAVSGDDAKAGSERLGRSLAGIVIASSLCAWAALASQPEWMNLSFCGPDGLSLTPFAISMDLALARPAELFWSGALMTLAMMAPMLVAPILALSFPRRHGRQLWGTALFVASYLAVWTVICLPLTIVAEALHMVLPAPLPLVLACVAAFAWEMFRTKRGRRYRVRVRPERPESSLGMLRYGIRYAIACAISCWVLMLLPLLAAHAHLGAMAIVTLWLIAAPHATGFARQLLGPPAILSLRSRDRPRSTA